MESLDDLRFLDRDVARADRAWRKWRRRLLSDPASHEEAPLDEWRHVAGQSTYRALVAMKPIAIEAPLRDALLRWVYALTQARIAQPLEIERAKEATKAEARVVIPKPHLTSWREAWRGVLTAATATERVSWLEAAAERAPAMASVERRLEERRREAAQRMGFDGGDALLPGEAARSLVAGAQAFLRESNDLARDVLSKARRRLELSEDPPIGVDAIAVAVAVDAPEGWPARLAWPWLERTFGHFARGLRVETVRLPEALGASSFARACAAFGAALRVAGASPSLPFALARDPQPLVAGRFAYVFGALPAEAAFQKRVLGNSARVADAQAKVLARTALLHARFQAARTLLADDSRPDRFEALTEEIYGAPLPRALAGAWPGRPGADLAALLTSRPLAKELVDRFDDDWFANPRAVSFVRALASGPAHEDVPADLTPAATALARAFEGALG